MIEIKNLSKTINNNKILDDINFSVKKGEILGLLGPNGAGKTSTMKIITSYWLPTSGSVAIDGLDAVDNSIETRKKIGYLPETVPLYEDMKVREYLKFVAEMRGIPRKRPSPEAETAAGRIEEVALSCGLSGFLDRPIDELSKGYRQRVGLAQAIIHNPEVLILDEPTTGLDPNQIVEIRELIKKIGSEKTVIFSSHILGEVSAICDRVIIINKGKIVGEGSPEELIKKTGAKEIVQVKVQGDKEKVLIILNNVPGAVKAAVSKEETGEIISYEIEAAPNIDIRAAATRALIAGGWNVLEISAAKVTLEDAFRELTK